MISLIKTVRFVSNLKLKAIKNIFKHIVIVYLSAFVLLSSIAIPFVAHTCSKTAHTDVSFMSKKAFCHHSEQNKCHNENAPALDKTACCFSLEGVIDSDTELVISQINGFDGILAIVKLPLVPQVVFATKQISSNYYSLAADKMKQVPLQVMQQSFLC